MIVGVPTEVKTREYRVGMIPAGARTLTERYLRDPTAVDPTLGGTALNIAARVKRL